MPRGVFVLLWKDFSASRRGRFGRNDRRLDCAQQTTVEWWVSVVRNVNQPSAARFIVISSAVEKSLPIQNVLLWKDFSTPRSFLALAATK